MLNTVGPNLAHRAHIATRLTDALFCVDAWLISSARQYIFDVTPDHLEEILDRSVDAATTSVHWRVAFSGLTLLLPSVRRLNSARCAPTASLSSSCLPCASRAPWTASCLP